MTDKKVNDSSDAISQTGGNKGASTSRSSQNGVAQNVVNIESNNEQKVVSRNFYALPNIITTAGLFAGFYAIMQSRLGHFEAACIAIYVAMIMDVLDGRLARLTNTQSEFGSQFDSLADMVSFGVAPALVIYEWSISGMGKLGSLVAFVYIACAALRLARFNASNANTDKKFFMGLASPAAAGLVISAMYVCVDYKVTSNVIAPLMCLLVFSAGILMVSNVKYRSFKDFDVKDRVPFIGLIILVLAFAAIYFDPPVAFLLVGASYFLSGLVDYVWHNWARK